MKYIKKETVLVTNFGICFLFIIKVKTKELLLIIDKLII